MTESQWDAFFAIDLKSVWLCAKHALPTMRAQRRGSIVTIASIHAFVTSAGKFPYAAAKSGVVGLSRSLALDEGKHGIRVNAVCPGFTRTRLVLNGIRPAEDPVATERGMIALHPLGGSPSRSRSRTWSPSLPRTRPASSRPPRSSSTAGSARDSSR